MNQWRNQAERLLVEIISNSTSEEHKKKYREIEQKKEKTHREKKKEVVRERISLNQMLLETEEAWKKGSG